MLRISGKFLVKQKESMKVYEGDLPHSPGDKQNVLFSTKSVS